MKKLLALTLFVIPLLTMVHANPDFSGRWTIDTTKSTALDPWRSLEIEIAVEGNQVAITRHFGGGTRKAKESMTLDTTLDSQVVEVEGWWDNRHIGAYLSGDKKQTVTAKWLDDGQTLQLNIDMMLETSQAATPVRVIRELRLSRDGKVLRVLQLRSSRNLPIVRVFDRL